MKISILVPVYKEPKYFADLARKMLNDSYSNREIIAVVDGDMNDEIKNVLMPFKKKIKIIYPGTHSGKALALNNAVKSLKTDILLFFDNDIMLPDNPDFLSILSEKMKTHDVVEMPKSVIVESPYSAMIGYEYLGFAMACSVFSLIANRSPGVIGAAFAVKKDLFDKLGGFRQVVHEDGDFGARAFRLSAKYSYCRRLKVETSMPNNLSDWITQRKRWTLINVLWFKDNFLYLMMRIFRQPSLIPAFFIIVLPAVVSFLLFYLFKHLKMSYLIHIAFMVTQPFKFISGILFWFTHYTMITEGLTSFILGFMISALTYFGFSRFMKFRFNILEYFLFYYLYMPFLVVVNVIMFILLIRKKKIHIDWKV
ncbi:MAG: glycosyltransferase family 2 protein [Spirochaetes bacterium]|nr:glycosyltransferase family 2 protein [Spirochaetota bacterium]